MWVAGTKRLLPELVFLLVLSIGFLVHIAGTNSSGGTVWATSSGSSGGSSSSSSGTSGSSGDSSGSSGSTSQDGDNGSPDGTEGTSGGGGNTSKSEPIRLTPGEAVVVAVFVLPYWVLNCLLSGMLGEACADIEIVPGEGSWLTKSDADPTFDRDTKVRVKVEEPLPGHKHPHLIVSQVPEANHPWGTFLLLFGLLIAFAAGGWMLGRRRRSQE